MVRLERHRHANHRRANGCSGRRSLAPRQPLTQHFADGTGSTSARAAIPGRGAKQWCETAGEGGGGGVGVGQTWLLCW